MSLDVTAEGASSDPTEGRIRNLKTPIWVGYSRAIKIRDQMEELFRHPTTHRMPNLAIVAESNNGKSMLLKNFKKKHPPINDLKSNRAEMPIILIDAPPEPSETRLYSALLEPYLSPGPSREPPDSKFQRLKVLTAALQTKMVLIDDFHNAIAGSGARQKKFLNAVRRLTNQLNLPVVVAGTPEMMNVLQSDPQLANRFQPHYLPKWSADDDYHRMLATLEKVVGLKKPSNLADGKISGRILSLSEGYLGEIDAIVRKAAHMAIDSGAEQICLDRLELKKLRDVGWVPPSDRTRRTPS